MAAIKQHLKIIKHQIWSLLDLRVTSVAQLTQQLRLLWWLIPLGSLIAGLAIGLPDLIRGDILMILVKGGTFFVAGVVGTLWHSVVVLKKIKHLATLSSRAKLIKNLPFVIADKIHFSTGSTGEVTMYTIGLKQPLPGGKIRYLESKPMFSAAQLSRHKTADLLIDELKPDDYIIDFVIEK